MKKSLLLATMVAMMFAEQVNALSIQLINGTEDACKLTQQSIIKGKIVGFNLVPWYIPAGTVASTFSILGDFFSSTHGSEIELTYQCGDHKKITLSSKENDCFLFTCEINAHVMDRFNMDADYRTVKGHYGWSGVLSWVLT